MPTNYNKTLYTARNTGTPGNFTRANPTAGIYKNPNTGVSPYDISKRGQTMYAPETFTTDRDMAALNAILLTIYEAL